MKKKFIFYILFAIISFCTIMFIFIKDTKDTQIIMSKKMIFQEALSHFNTMIITRKWNSNHGSVYVKEHDGLKANPYLENNYIYTKNNEKLIRINPAWMTRQISELSNKNSNYYFRITSLKPLNPNNTPDKFEKEALTYFEKNKNKKYYTNFTSDKYNFMGSLKVEKSCLDCHAEQGYKLNDIRGGLRVSIPIKTYNENVRVITDKSNLLYAITIIISFIAMFVSFYLLKLIYTKQNIIEELNVTLEKKVIKRTKEIELISKKLKKTNETLLEISTIDFLTNIPNRRYFFDIGEKSFHLSTRYETKLSIIAIDIDYFKNINDTYGHKIGDKILKRVSGIINKLTRKSDTLCRIGGEEFAIILDSTGNIGAESFAEKIRNAVHDNPYEHEGEIIFTSISLGVAQKEINDKNIDDILAKADTAMYKAKKEGRNKTVVFKIV